MNKEKNLTAQRASLRVDTRETQHRSVPEIHSHVAGTLSNQPTNNCSSSALLIDNSPNLPSPLSHHRLVGPVVKAYASRAEDSGFESRLRRGDFFGSSHTSDFKIGTPVATLPGAWRYRVSAGTGWPGVSIL